MSKLLVISFLLIAQFSKAQSPYWQQYLHYTIEVKLDDEEKQLSGKEKIVYINNSPKTLDYIWFHIYPNAYKDNKTAFVQQVRYDRDYGGQLSKKYLGGFIDSLDFKVDGEKVKTEPHPQYNDIIKLLLPKPLQPKDSIIITTPFRVKLPKFYSRSGYDKDEFMVCQWYPKPAVFDNVGWHEMPYLSTGEFYSEYGSYKVNITLPSGYVVGATGILQDSAESIEYKSLGIYNNLNRSQKPKYYSSSSIEPYKTLHYFSDSVPDFAWFADKNFVIEYDTMKLKSGKVTDVFSYFKFDFQHWRQSPDYIKDAVRHYSKWIGEYDYPVVQAVQGPAKAWDAGGMEYPMITLISLENGTDSKTLDEVITHEVGHNWFMAMLGTNEREYAWMDEGLNTYFEYRYMAEKYKTNEYFPPELYPNLKNLDEKDFLASVYRGLLEMPIYPAISTPSESFKNSAGYFAAEYQKAATWVYLLQSTIGQKAIDKAFRNYFETWKFKHPKPVDMELSFEQTIQKDLNSYFALLYKKGKLLGN
ncbi:MAG: M1 family metallopeptidase [Ginsengibacter sp.]